jgi:hypothetical protein
MSREVAWASICFSLNYAARCLAFGGARHEQFADALASDLKNRLRIEIAWELQIAFSGNSGALGSNLFLK